MTARQRLRRFVLHVAIVALTAAVLAVGSGCATVAGRVFLPRENIRPAEYSVSSDRLQTQMTDGTLLVSHVYRPREIEKTPTIFARIPMSTSFKNRLLTNVLGDFWASRGYTVVLQTTRGRKPSGGAFYPLRPQRADGIDTLHWLAEQPWYDGRIGMWGGSSFGYTQWCISDQTDPGPSTHMIQIASSRFYDAFYHGNAFALETALYWTYRSYRDWDRKAPHALLDRGADGFPLLEADDRAMGDVSFFNDWARHVERDAYWVEIDGEDRIGELRAPVHLMAGWFDPFLPAQLDDYIRIQNDARPEVARGTRLVVGPWAHAHTVELPGGFKDQKYRKSLLGPTIDWFDTHLAGTSDAALQSPPVKLFVMGINQWRDEQEWPLARAHETAYFLRGNGPANTANGDGRLSREAAPAYEPPDAYTYDPRDPVPMAGGAVLGARGGVALQSDVEQRHDVLVYTTPVLDRDTEVTGPVRLILYVSTSAPNTDFTAKLVDVHPDGDAYNVSEGILRRSYQPGDVTEIAIDLWPTSMAFFRGHRIRLQVSSSSFPRFDRNPNTGAFIPTETQPVPAQQRIHHGADTPSRLLLPIVPAK